MKTGVLVLLLVAGCAPSRIDLKPESDRVLERRADRAALLRVPDAGPGGLDVLVSSLGAYRVDAGEREAVSVHVTVEVENRSEREAAAFFPDSAELRDRDGRNLVIEGRPAGGETDAIPIPAGEARRFDLTFRSPRDEDDARDLAPFLLGLRFGYGTATHEVRVLLEYDPPVTYYYPYRGYYPGFYPGFYPSVGFGYYHGF